MRNVHDVVFVDVASLPSPPTAMYRLSAVEYVMPRTVLAPKGEVRCDQVVPSAEYAIFPELPPARKMPFTKATHWILDVANDDVLIVHVSPSGDEASEPLPPTAMYVPKPYAVSRMSYVPNGDVSWLHVDAVKGISTASNTPCCATNMLCHQVAAE